MSLTVLNKLFIYYEPEKHLCNLYILLSNVHLIYFQVIHCAQFLKILMTTALQYFLKQHFSFTAYENKFNNDSKKSIIIQSTKLIIIASITFK